MTGKIYGTGEIKSVGNAFLRGAAAGGAGSGLDYLSDALTPRPGRLGRSSLSGLAGMMLTGAASAVGRDPRRGCEGGSRDIDWLGAQMAYGYQYDRIQPAQMESGFSFADFGKEVLGGAITGGLASAAFYGAGKAIRALAGSIRSNKTGGAPDNIVYRAINQKDYDSLMQGRGLEAKKPNGTWTLRDHLVKGSGGVSWENDPFIATTSDLNVAKGFNESGNGLGIVAIDLDKIAGSTYKGYEIFPRVNGFEGLPYHYSVWQQETTVYHLAQ